MNTKQKIQLSIIFILVICISLLHYNTPTKIWQFHLVYMQAYFIPIILAAFQFGVKGGLGIAILVSAIYFPHIMLQWGGLIENNLMRFLQIGLFNIVGYLTGLKSQGERKEKERYQAAANDLTQSIEKLKEQSERISEMEDQVRAADRLAIIGELTASLAHEVRNPLGSIRGAVEIIRDKVPDEIKNFEFFDILVQDTERLNQVVENYLNFSKKQTNRLSEYSLNETINNIVLMIGAQARKNRVQLKTDIDTGNYSLQGDPNHLWQILINVLLNAIQAMPEGGEILIDVKSLDIMNIERIFGNRANGDTTIVCLSITDTGKGISEEDLQDVFTAFYTTKNDGSGLGLAIVKRIAEENGWKIEVKSKQGVGTEFAIYLPVKINK